MIELAAYGGDSARGGAAAAPVPSPWFLPLSPPPPPPLRRTLHLHNHHQGTRRAACCLSSARARGGGGAFFPPLGPKPFCSSCFCDTQSHSISETVFIICTGRPKPPPQINLPGFPTDGNTDFHTRHHSALTSSTMEKGTLVGFFSTHWDDSVIFLYLFCSVPFIFKHSSFAVSMSYPLIAQKVLGPKQFANQLSDPPPNGHAFGIAIALLRCYGVF